MAVLTAQLPTSRLDPEPYRLDVEEYAQIVDSGALDNKRVELIDGIILRMSPQSPEHSAVIARLTMHFAGAAGHLRIQLPAQVAADSVPDPDLAVVAGPPSPKHHPTTALLVAEVAQSSHALDRGRKAELYAAAGFPTYWLVDLPARTVEVRTDPAPAGYRTMRTLAPGDLLPSPCAGVADLAVDRLLEGI